MKLSYSGVALAVWKQLRQVTHFTGLNVLNAGSITGMQADDVVEVSCIIDKDGPRPLPVGEIPPEGPYLLMRDVKRYERLASEAILTRSR
jgi:6-phospho-beta-glucosidase